LFGGQIGIPPNSAATLSTRKSGTLRVDFRFADDHVLISEGTVTMPLRSDWGYSVEIYVDTVDVGRGCLGCVGSRSFPLAPAYRRSAADSVRVLWAGNSISNPVIY